MEIKLRAQRILNGGVVEQDISTTMVIGNQSGIQYRCESATLEIVIDGQAVKVAKIRELLTMRLKIKSVIDLYYDDWSNDEIAESITKILNNIEEQIQ